MAAETQKSGAHLFKQARFSALYGIETLYTIGFSTASQNLVPCGRQLMSHTGWCLCTRICSCTVRKWDFSFGVLFFLTGIDHRSCGECTHPRRDKPACWWYDPQSPQWVWFHSASTEGDEWQVMWWTDGLGGGGIVEAQMRDPFVKNAFHKYEWTKGVVICWVWL